MSYRNGESAVSVAAWTINGNLPGGPAAAINGVALNVIGGPGEIRTLDLFHAMEG